MNKAPSNERSLLMRRLIVQTNGFRSKSKRCLNLVLENGFPEKNALLFLIARRKNERLHRARGRE